MKAAALLLLMVPLAFVPLAPAASLVPAPAAAPEACDMPCCHGKKSAAADNCAPACSCPVACIVPAQNIAVVPSVSEVFPPHFLRTLSRLISDETGAVRNDRPPVPPPRA